MQFDLKSYLNFEPSIIPQTSAGNIDGSAIDTKGSQSCAMFGFVDGTAEGSFKIQDSADGSTGWADVADAKVLSEANDKAHVASDIVKLGVVNSKRYLRVVFTETTSGVVSAGIVLGCNSIVPTGTN
jgi:hypothetical protein